MLYIYIYFAQFDYNLVPTKYITYAIIEIKLNRQETILQISFQVHNIRSQFGTSSKSLLHLKQN